MKIEVSKLRSNPFRNLERLPLDPEKVEALVHSIKDTSFWDNLIGRETAGGVEIAYGHHRVAAPGRRTPRWPTERGWCWTNRRPKRT